MLRDSKLLETFPSQERTPLILGHFFIAEWVVL